MKTKKVNRYKCDHCGKVGYSAMHMTRHEIHCTKNPNRVCRVCKMLEQEQLKLDDLLTCLPDPEDYKQNGDLIVECPITGESLTRVANNCLPELRQLSGDCPACMMAAIRQKGIPVPVVSDFSFTDRMKEIWDDINDSRLE